MRAILVAAAALSAALIATPPSPARTSTTPALHVVQLRPLTIRGTGFRPLLHVTVRLDRGSTHLTRRTTTTSLGTFRTTFATVDIDRCQGYAITVTGPTGRTLVTLKPRPLCPPP
jgi:hypothetical protein